MDDVWVIMDRVGGKRLNFVYVVCFYLYNVLIFFLFDVLRIMYNIWDVNDKGRRKKR